MPSYPSNFNNDIPLNGGLVVAYPQLQGAGTSLLEYVRGLKATGGTLQTALWTPFPHPANVYGGGATTFAATANAFTSGAVTAPLLPTTNGYTLVAWYLRTSSSGTASARIITLDDNVNTTSFISSLMFDSPTNNHMAIYQKAATTDGDRGALASMDTLNQWYFIAATFNGTTGFTLYGGDMDTFFGDVTGTTPNVAPVGAITNTSARVIIGNRADGARPWLGKLGPIYAYKRVLSPGEIYQLWQDPYAPVRDRVRVYRLPFDVEANAATITATGNQDADILGAGQVTPAGITLSGSGFADSGPVLAGAATLSLGVTIQGKGYTSPDSAGAGTLSITLQGKGYATSPDQPGAATLSNSLSIAGSGLVDAGNSGAGTLAPVATLPGKGLSPTGNDQAGAATVSPLVTIAGSGLTETTIAGKGTLTPTATIAGSGLNGTDQTGAGSVAPAGVTIQGAGLTSQDAYGAAVITSGVIASVPGSGFISTDRPGAGSVSLGAVTIQGKGFSSPDSLGAATITSGVIGNIPGSGFIATDQGAAGTISLGAVTLSGQGFRDTPIAGASVVSPVGVTIQGKGYSDPVTQVRAGAGSVSSSFTVIGSGLAADNPSGAAILSLPVYTIQGSGYRAPDEFGSGLVLGPVIFTPNRPDVTITEASRPIATITARDFPQATIAARAYPVASITESVKPVTTISERARPTAIIGPRQYLVIAIDENSARPQATISEPDRPGATISEVEEKIT